MNVAKLINKYFMFRKTHLDEIKQKISVTRKGKKGFFFHKNSFSKYKKKLSLPNGTIIFIYSSLNGLLYFFSATVAS